VALPPFDDEWSAAATAASADDLSNSRRCVHHSQGSASASCAAAGVLAGEQSQLSDADGGEPHELDTVCSAFCATALSICSRQRLRFACAPELESEQPTVAAKRYDW